jgi:hypothetical protein
VGRAIRGFKRPSQPLSLPFAQQHLWGIGPIPFHLHRHPPFHPPSIRRPDRTFTSSTRATWHPRYRCYLQHHPSHTPTTLRTFSLVVSCRVRSLLLHPPSLPSRNLLPFPLDSRIALSATILLYILHARSHRRIHWPSSPACIIAIVVSAIHPPTCAVFVPCDILHPRGHYNTIYLGCRHPLSIPDGTANSAHIRLALATSTRRI